MRRLSGYQRPVFKLEEYHYRYLLTHICIYPLVNINICIKYIYNKNYRCG